MVEQVEIECTRCNQCCYGDVINAYGKYYHQYCFSCVVAGCSKDLAEVGFFLIDEEIYCRDDYHKLLGIKCAGCLKYVEGDAISALESRFHPTCFGCVTCGKVFPVGSEICYDGEDFFCQSCNTSPKKPVATVSPQIESKQNELANSESPCGDENKVDPLVDIRAPYEDKKLAKCAGCENVIKDGQALLALEKQWHLWCFTCNKCGALLTAEYMGRDGIPYCEKDYQAQFGICCAGCGGYITGKVLQAGEKHYHPQCSRCAKCGEMFGEGEDMYLQGNEIWHPACSDEAEEQQERGSDSSMSDESEQESPRYSDEALGSTYTSTPSIEAKPAATTEPSEWKPQSQNINPIPYGKPPGFRSVKPPGFRSVQPPVPVASETSKSPADEDDEAPPIPPPPARSSSSHWRQKYSAARHMSAPATNGDTAVRPHSYVITDSGASDNEETPQLSVAYSTNSLNSNSSSKTNSLRKGIGYNQLQHRMNSNKDLRFKLPTNIDPDRLRQFLDDPQHNVYLEDHEFLQIFKMTREKFYALPQSKKQELKDGILFT